MVAWIRTRAKPCRSLNLTAPTRCKLRFHPLRFHGESPLFPHHSVSYSTSLFLSVPFLLHFLLFLSRLYFPSSFPPLLVLPFSISVSRSFVPLSLFRASRASSRTRIFFDISLALFLLFSLSLSLLSFFYNFFAFFPFSLVFVPLSFFIFRHACFAKRIFSFCVFYLFLSLVFLNFFPSHPFSCFFFLLLLSFKFSFSFTSFHSYSVFYLFSFFLFCSSSFISLFYL